jgi:redox-sensitive bicupin YhaK (pirin superfamily)
MKQAKDLFAFAQQTAKEEQRFSCRSDRNYWLQMIKGKLEVNVGATRILLTAGDGAGFEKVQDLNLDLSLHLQWSENAEFLLFDLISS